MHLVLSKSPVTRREASLVPNLSRTPEPVPPPPTPRGPQRDQDRVAGVQRSERKGKRRPASHSPAGAARPGAPSFLRGKDRELSIIEGGSAPAPGDVSGSAAPRQRGIAGESCRGGCTPEPRGPGTEGGGGGCGSPGRPRHRKDCRGRPREPAAPPLPPPPPSKLAELSPSARSAAASTGRDGVGRTALCRAGSQPRWTATTRWWRRPWKVRPAFFWTRGWGRRLGRRAREWSPRSPSGWGLRGHPAPPGALGRPPCPRPWPGSALHPAGHPVA